MISGMATNIDAERPVRRKLDLNSATADELQEIDGVSPDLARRLVEHRQRNGGFKSLDELASFDGVDDASELKRALTCGPS
jgi:DNA uptake protein ComE-like DNA-binding protein